MASGGNDRKVFKGPIGESWNCEVANSSRLETYREPKPVRTVRTVLSTISVSSQKEK